MEHGNKFQQFVKALFHIDEKVFYAFLYRISQAFVGILTIFFITSWFQPGEQGYYYTFNSLIALQIIFEMGFSFVIVQFSAHDFAALHWSKRGNIVGPREAVEAFSLFVGKCCKTYTIIAFCAFVIIWVVGNFFFRTADNATPVNWSLPWLLLCLMTMGNLLLTPFFAIIEGSGRVKEINQFKTIQNTVGALILWIAMMNNLKLYSIGLDLLFCFVFGLSWLWKKYPNLIGQAYHRLLRSRKELTSISRWSNEIWPMQWRIGISWISG